MITGKGLKERNRESANPGKKNYYLTMPTPDQSKGGKYDVAVNRRGGIPMVRKEEK
jgi:hypothetical protein